MADPVVIKSGEVVRFPVPSDHPLAQYQQLRDVSEIPNLHDLAAVRTLTRTMPAIATQRLVDAVKGILSSAGMSKIVSLTFSDITVQAGAKLVWSGPINQVSAGKIVVDGEIIAYGSLNLTCSALGGSGGSVHGVATGGGIGW